MIIEELEAQLDLEKNNRAELVKPIDKRIKNLSKAIAELKSYTNESVNVKTNINTYKVGNLDE